MSAESLADQAYLRLRDMIVRLELSPGSLLSQDDLQRTIGVGRTPIHQAIQRLALEELVVVAPRRGVFVTNVDVLELPVLYESRIMLEPYMAAAAAERGASGDWDQMEAALNEVAPDSSVDDRVRADRRCHEIIWSAAGNRFLTRTLDLLYAQSDRLWHMYLIDVTDMHQSIDEHVGLLNALRLGDADEAASQMRNHIRSLHDQVNNVIEASIRSSRT